MKSEGLIGCSRPSRPREENEFSEWEKTTMLKPLIPEGESLRRAFQWLADQEGHCTLKTVEQASLLFDLNPRDEEFLLRQFVHHRGAASDAPESGQ